MSQDELVGRSAALIPVGPEHYELLRTAEVARLGQWWRNRGQLSSPEEFARRIWAGTALQMIAVGTQDGKALSWLQCFGVEPAAGIGSIAIARLGEGLMSVRNGVAIAKFVEHCFVSLGLRKLYFETAEPNMSSFASMQGELLVEEGRLAEHVYFDGARHDFVVLTLWRETWERWPMRSAYLNRW